MYRFTHVVFGITSSLYHLNATIRYHLSKFREKYPHIVDEVVLKSLYVDDFLGGADDIVGGAKLYRVITENMRDAGLNMRKWATNFSEFSAIIEKSERTT